MYRGKAEVKTKLTNKLNGTSSYSYKSLNMN